MPLPKPPSVADSPYVPPDIEAANEEWGATCGPVALAAIARCPLAEIRHLFPNFPKQRWVNPTGMRKAMDAIGMTYTLPAKRFNDDHGARHWPRFGLAFIQFTGSWDTAPIAAQYTRTHWVGVIALSGTGRGIFDVNVGVWSSFDHWSESVVPLLIRNQDATGYYVRASYQVHQLRGEP